MAPTQLRFFETSEPMPEANEPKSPEKASTGKDAGARGQAAAKEAPSRAAAAKKAKGAEAKKQNRRGGSRGKNRKSGSAKTAATKKIIASDALPRRTLAEAIPIAEALRNYANKTATWEEIARALNVTASNNRNKYLLWSAVAYGLVKQDGDNYKLAEVGRKITAPTTDDEEQEGKLKAILTPSVLSQFYTEYNGNPLPPESIFLNVLETRYDIPRDRAAESRNLLIANARDVGILRPGPSGAEVFQFSPTTAPPKPGLGDQADGSGSTGGGMTSADASIRIVPDSCFIITPIGEPGSDERKHADAVLKHLIEPVLQGVNLKVLRADKITKPGIINKQIVEHLAYSKLCIADLSFNNPNAFYEMGMRHALKLPMIQIIRKGDKIPFDVAPGRTIIIDCSDPYLIMDAFQSARSELKEHVDSVVDGKVTTDDEPMALYLPGLKVSIPPIAQ